MNSTTLTKNQEQLLDLEGAKLREMMKSEGWAVMSKLFKMTVERYDSTQGIKTIKELLARQYSLAMMNEWMETVVQRVSRLDHNDAMRRMVNDRVSNSGMVIVNETDEDEAS